MLDSYPYIGNCYKNIHTPNIFIVVKIEYGTIYLKHIVTGRIVDLSSKQFSSKFIKVKNIASFSFFYNSNYGKV